MFANYFSLPRETPRNLGFWISIPQILPVNELKSIRRREMTVSGRVDSGRGGVFPLRREDISESVFSSEADEIPLV